MSTADCVWLRTSKLQPPDVDAPTVSVNYLTPAPDGAGSWIAVSFSSIGDGDPTSRSNALSIELFDAIMGTWRCRREPAVI